MQMENIKETTTCKFVDTYGTQRMFYSPNGDNNEYM